MPSMQRLKEDITVRFDFPSLRRCTWLRLTWWNEYLTALDLRFNDKEQERCFKKNLEGDLLRWMLVGSTLAAVCTTFNSIATFGPELLNQGSPHDFSNFKDTRNLVFFGQILLWTVVPAILSCLIALRIFFEFFLTWHWEIVITSIMGYGSMVIVIGQLYHLTVLFGGDPDDVWKNDVTCSAEAWVLLGLNSMTTAAAFFLPLRSVVSWSVPVIGLITYIIMKVAFDDDTPPSQLLVKIALLMALSYLAWHGAFRTEKHLRTEWRAIREVQKASEQIEEQQVSIQQKSRQIQEKEKEVEATTDLVRSLQTVTKALCDTMVHLTADLRIRNADTSVTFFEQDVEGLAFTDLLNKEDQSRFAACVSRATQAHIPVCLPVTLKKQYSTSECHLVLVHRGNTELRYLIGIRVERDYPSAFEPLRSAEDEADAAVRRGSNGAAPASSTEAAAAAAATAAQATSLPGSVNQGHAFTPIIPCQINSIDEDLESDFSFTTYPKHDPPRPPKLTNFRARARTIRMILKRWNVPRDCESCCQYHTVLETIDEAVECLRQQKCDPLWSTYSQQCPRCACMNQGPKCVVCGFLVEEKPRGSSTGRSSGR
mmetsp:Transcript_122393/g.318154  ORF Transcript_122393/g.318154 Transcript_122393/m.318154 type:complete len:597 (-) Transcript_122393:60-1850(-)